MKGATSGQLFRVKEKAENELIFGVFFDGAGHGSSMENGAAEGE